jgi:hypothetical protein
VACTALTEPVATEPVASASAGPSATAKVRPSVSEIAAATQRPPPASPPAPGAAGPSIKVPKEPAR